MVDEIKIIKIYRAWDLLEKKIDPEGPGVVDFDLSPDLNLDVTFEDRLEVLCALENSCAEAVESCDQYLISKIRGSIAYLKCLMGGLYSFKEYINETIGVEPYTIPEKSIKIQRRLITDLVKKDGIDFTRESFEKFEESYRIFDPKIIEQTILESKDQVLRQVGNLVDLPNMLRINIDFKDVDAYWQNWVHGNLKDGITLTINLNKRNAFYFGDPELLAYHEICGHLLQMSYWAEGIRRGKINPSWGIITVHTPEQFLLEGLAQTITDIAFDQDSLSKEAVRAREFYRYRFYVYSNAHKMINEGVGVREVHDYVFDHLPFEPTSTILSEIRDRSLNVLLRSYQYVYAISDLFFKRVFAKGNVGGELLSKLYKTPMDTRQLYRFIG